MKDQTAGRSRRFDYRDVNKCATMRGNGFLLTRLHRAGGVFVPSRPVPTGKNVTRRSAFSTPLTDPPTIRRFWEFCAPQSSLTSYFLGIDYSSRLREVNAVSENDNFSETGAKQGRALFWLP